MAPRTNTLTAIAGATPRDWQESVVGNLRQAVDVSSTASDQMHGSLVQVRITNADHNRHRDTVHSHFQQKIRNTEELHHQLATRARCIRNTIEHAEWSLGKINEASHALIAPIDICRQRLLLRQKRPKREIVFDDFQKSLLAEEKQLELAKSKLADCRADTQALVRDLREMHAELECDLQDKQHSLRIDQYCVGKKGPTRKLDKSYSRQKHGVIPAFPEILSSAASSVESEGRLQERDRQKTTFRSIEAALRLEQVAKERFQRTTELIETTLSAAKATQKATQADMGKKIEHTELLRQELTTQRKAVEKKIAELQKVLSQTTDKANFLEKPISSSRQRTHIRDLRTPRECTADEVSEALSSQQHALQTSKLQLQTKVTNLQQTLNELQVTSEQLAEDINDKEQGLRIDRSCASCKNTSDGHQSFGFAKVGHGQRHFSDTVSSMLRQSYG